MAANRPTHYRLAPAAAADLEDIWVYTAKNWSIDQADKYTDALEDALNVIVAMPEIARERHELDPPVRIHPSGQHLVIYRVMADHVAILRILGGRRNWQALLDVLE